jgi:hypothetical protein
MALYKTKRRRSSASPSRTVKKKLIAHTSTLSERNSTLLPSRRSLSDLSITDPAAPYFSTDTQSDILHLPPRPSESHCADLDPQLSEFAGNSMSTIHGRFCEPSLIPLWPSFGILNRTSPDNRDISRKWYRGTSSSGALSLSQLLKSNLKPAKRPTTPSNAYLLDKLRWYNHMSLREPTLESIRVAPAHAELSFELSLDPQRAQYWSIMRLLRNILDESGPCSKKRKLTAEVAT